VALVFVSYRTEDAAHVAAALHERLVAAFGSEQVFRDVRSMGPGERYPSIIRSALRRADVVVAVIGPRWLAARECGKRLVDRERDWVRWEITTAVELGIPIVPVLVDDTPLPDAAVLPGQMAELTRFQVARVRHTDQGPDLDRLAAALVQRVPALAPSHRPRRPRRHRLMYVAGAAVTLAAIGLVSALPILNRGDSPAESGRSAQGDEFTAAAPWRLVIRDNISNKNVGCNVILTKTDTDQQMPVPTSIFVTKSFQMYETGSFRWEVNDPGCVVTVLSGPGQEVLPFVHDRGGDTDAFQAGGPVTVKIVNFYGNPECKFVLHDAADGKQLDFGSARQSGGPVVLDPNGRSQVYIANLHCGASISAG